MANGYRNYKVWSELPIHSHTSTVQPLTFGKVSVISSYTLQGMWLLIHAGIEVNPC